MADGMTLPLPILGAILGAIAGSQLGDAGELAMSLSAAGGVAGFLAAVGLRRLRPAATRRGSGRFQNLRERRNFQLDGGIIIGRDTDTGRLPRHDGPAHLLTVAPTRAGKGTGAILPNLPTLDRPAIVIDPKSENFRVSARQRSTFGPVQALDPFGILGSAAGRLNPLDSLDVRSDNCAEDAAAMADTLVADDSGDREAAHWNGEARALIAGLLLHCASSADPAKRTPGFLRHCLTLPPAETHRLLREMQASTSAGGLVARAAGRRLQQNEREAASILSTAQRHTHFLDFPQVAASLAGSDFALAEIMQRNGTVFLALPPDRLRTCSRWLRLLVGQAIRETVRNPPQGRRALLLLDECASLGYLRPLEDALGVAAGYGLQIWCVFQDMHQLRARYGRAADSFLANAGMLQFFNVSDLETARWLSESLGRRTVAGRGRSGGEARPLLTADEILSLDARRMLLLPRDGRPLLADRPEYFSDAEFAGLFDPATPPAPRR